MTPGLWVDFAIIALTQLTWSTAVPEVDGRLPSRSQLELQILQNTFQKLNHFHPYVRPGNDDPSPDEPLLVTISMHILNMAVDTRRQEIDVQMYFREEWNDTRLSFDGQDQLKMLSGNDVNALWTPDLFFVNEKSGYFHTLTKPNTLVRIYPEGTIKMSRRMSVRLICPMDLRKYPFDNQICGMHIESYGYTANELILKWKPETTFGLNEPSDFHVAYSTSEETIQFSENSYTRITLNIHLTRIPHKQLYHVFLPILFMVAVSWVTLCMEPTWISRLPISATITFTALLHLQSTREFFHLSSYPTILDTWVGFSLLLIFAALFLNVIVISAQECCVRIAAKTNQ
ncbi:hypothetical protein RUM44_012062 [Polyplax serrata]|uniref:Neurotransmitter-gated ion-channel ligand-binding domain-containing protein n=1 Tax=Polyplax serrata TaxID=468196 RepID=A0ABR1BC38_POLSC